MAKIAGSRSESGSESGSISQRRMDLRMRIVSTPKCYGSATLPLNTVEPCLLVGRLAHKQEEDLTKDITITRDESEHK
jgi:hypothetical protein